MDRNNKTSPFLLARASICSPRKYAADGDGYIFVGAPIEDQWAPKLPIDRELWTEKFPGAANLIARFA